MENDIIQLNYPLPIAFKYLPNSRLTTGYKKNSPIMLGNTMANIIASEKAQIDPILAAATNYDK